MTENGKPEAYDVSVTVASTKEDGRSYLVEQQRVPLDATATALATCLRAMMGQLHPRATVTIDPSAFGDSDEVPEDRSESLNPAVHDQIVSAMTLFRAWAQRGDEYATLTAGQVTQVMAALTAADALAHLVSGRGVLQSTAVRVVARVLLGEANGIPVFRDGTLGVDGDRPDGSVMVTLDPPLSGTELGVLRSDDPPGEVLNKLLAVLLRYADGRSYCRVCGASSQDSTETVAGWALSHFRDAGCWQPVQQWEPENQYVPALMVRPGDEVRVEFQQNDGTFVDNPTENGDNLDHGYVTDTVVMTGSGAFVLDDDDHTPLQMKDDTDHRPRRIFLIKRGEWSSAIQAVQGLKRERAERFEGLRSALGTTLHSSDTEIVDMVRLLRQQAVNRRVYLSHIATALGLPPLTEDTPVGTEVETVRAVMGRLRAEPFPGVAGE